MIFCYGSVTNGKMVTILPLTYLVRYELYINYILNDICSKIVLFKFFYKKNHTIYKWEIIVLVFLHL